MIDRLTEKCLDNRLVDARVSLFVRSQIRLIAPVRDEIGFVDTVLTKNSRMSRLNYILTYIRSRSNADENSRVWLVMVVPMGSVTRDRGMSSHH